MPSSQNPLTFQELILRLQTFWAEHGCVLQQPYDVEVGAGTMAPETFLRVLGPKPYNVGYVQPSRRPADGRYGENPNRLFKHMQYQVILKPPPENVQQLYLDSLTALGIDLRKHDTKFEEDNWESPTLGAWGIGWQVMLDGLEITQFTYFQQCGGLDLDPISAELTYGLERIAAFLQDVDSIYDITWVVGQDGRPVKYGEIRLQDELQFSVYNFERADVERAWKHLELYEAECQALLQINWSCISRPTEITYSWDDVSLISFGRLVRIQSGERTEVGFTPDTEYHFRIAIDRTDGTVRPIRPDERVDLRYLIPLNSSRPIAISTPTSGTIGRSFKITGVGLPLPALDLCLKCSHLFNILDARGAISVTERVGVIARIRALAVGVAKAYVDQQQAEEESISPSGEDASPAPEPLAASRL